MKLVISHIKIFYNKTPMQSTANTDITYIEL